MTCLGLALSGRQDSDLRLPVPETDTLPDYATPCVVLAARKKGPIFACREIGMDPPQKYSRHKNKGTSRRPPRHPDRAKRPEDIAPRMSRETHLHALCQALRYAPECSCAAAKWPRAFPWPCTNRPFRSVAHLPHSFGSRGNNVRLKTDLDRHLGVCNPPR